MNEYLAGHKLYGDDFSIEQIKQWYDEEAEGYADLVASSDKVYTYGYHELNKAHGYKCLKNKHFEQVLGFGSAWGNEFEPIIDQIGQITIIEPSDHLRSAAIGHVTPQYVKPTIEGALPFEDNTFDLVTCFGTLHHIPNVSFVVQEIVRVMKPGGYLLLREPIISMGDWRQPRRGLTKNERGIPAAHFDALFGKLPVKIISKTHCLTVTALLQTKLGRYLSKPIFSYRAYILWDKWLSNMVKSNVKYHAQRKIDRIAPNSIFYVVQKS